MPFVQPFFVFRCLLLRRLNIETPVRLKNGHKREQKLSRIGLCVSCAFWRPFSPHLTAVSIVAVKPKFEVLQCRKSRTCCALDAGSETAALDSSGNDFDGTLMHGVVWTNDVERGTCAYFDGADDRIATPFTYALASSNRFTGRSGSAQRMTTLTELLSVIAIRTALPILKGLNS